MLLAKTIDAVDVTQDDLLGPMFNEQMQLKDGRMHVSDRPGLGFSLSEQALAWTTETQEFGKRP